jgi:hypothetical protein
MIRVLFGSALPVLGLGLAAGFFGPDLLSGPRGEPLIMAAPDQASLQAATFEGKACPSTLLFAGSADAEKAGSFAGTHIVAFALRSSEKDVAVAIQDFPGGDGKASRTIVLVFDDKGQLVAAGDPASLDLPLGDKIATDCPPDTAAPI